MARRPSFSAVVVAVLTMTSLPLTAHHGIGAAYGVCRTVTLDGVLTGLEWRNPHVALHLNVDGRTVSAVMGASGLGEAKAQCASQPPR